MEKRRILVVDDEEDFVSTVRERLVFEGFEVLEATAGDKAADLLTRETPDLIILDIMMPGMDGLALFRRIRGNPDTARIPVVFVSVRWDFFNDPAVSSDQRVKVLRKPFDLEVLVRTVKESLP